MAKMAKELFMKGDTDASQCLDYKEVKELIGRLHVMCSEEYLDKIFKKYDTNNNGKMEFSEFEQYLADLLNKEELKPLFKSYAKATMALPDFKGDDQLMTLNELRNFFLTEQNEDYSIAQLQEMVQYYTDKSQINSNQISFYTFLTMLFSEFNSILDPNKKKVYQALFLSFFLIFP